MQREIGGKYKRPVGAPASWLTELLADLRRSVSGPIRVRLITDGAIPRTTPALLDENGALHQEYPLATGEVVVLKLLDADGLPHRRLQR
jgi:hypothetical protein